MDSTAPQVHQRAQYAERKKARNGTEQQPLAAGNPSHTRYGRPLCQARGAFQRKGKRWTNTLRKTRLIPCSLGELHLAIPKMFPVKLRAPAKST